MSDQLNTRCRPAAVRAVVGGRACLTFPLAFRPSGFPPRENRWHQELCTFPVHEVSVLPCVMLRSCASVRVFFGKSSMYLRTARRYNVHRLDQIAYHADGLRARVGVDAVFFPFF